MEIYIIYPNVIPALASLITQQHHHTTTSPPVLKTVVIDMSVFIVVIEKFVWLSWLLPAKLCVVVELCVVVDSCGC